MKSTKTTLALALALALSAASGGALAGEAHAHGDGANPMGCAMMDMHDLSSEARKAKMDEMFGQVDTDKNGSISRAEFDRHHEHMMSTIEKKRRKPHNHVEEHK